MADEMLVLPVQAEIPVVESVDHSTRPEPTAEEQQAADAIFSPEQNELAASLLAAQMGLGLLHNLAAESFQRAEEREKPRRKERPEDEER
jgi:hypothetical protein